MKWFFKKQRSASRSWEEISTPRAGGIEENVTNGDNFANGVPENTVGDSDEGAFDKGAQPENREKFVKIPKKSLGEFSKKIENLDFDPATYYGWGDSKVDEWMQKLTKAWNVVASVFWFIFGSLTFAPVLFTANKLDKFFDDKMKSLVVSAIIYFVFVAALVIMLFLR